MEVSDCISPLAEESKVMSYGPCLVNRTLNFTVRFFVDANLNEEYYNNATLSFNHGNSICPDNHCVMEY